jgi:hypothetical protein
MLKDPIVCKHRFEAQIKEGLVRDFEQAQFEEGWTAFYNGIPGPLGTQAQRLGFMAARDRERYVALYHSLLKIRSSAIWIHNDLAFQLDGISNNVDIDKIVSSLDAVDAAIKVAREEIERLKG